MAVTGETVYIKGDGNVEVTKPTVTLGDLVQMECANPSVAPRLKTVKVLKFSDRSGKHSYHGNSRTVVSVLKLIECIHKVYPGMDVQNLGAQDIIVTYETQRTAGQFVHWLKIALVVLISFTGSAFSIMAFNNDVDTTKVFDQIYELLMGKPSNGFTLLEVTYSIGIVIGILVFFNHFGRKRFSVDPTPMEVEMRLYENDIQTTLVENYSRKGQEIDVGTADIVNDHRT